MPEQRAVESVVGNPSTTAEIESIPKETRQQKKARLAQVLDRGMTNDRLAVPKLPKNLHGEWIARDTSEISRMESLGFWIDTEFATQRSLNSDGTRTSQVGDVIFMVCPMEDHVIMEEIKHENFLRVHGDPSQRARYKQGGDHPALVNPEKDIDIEGWKTIDESVERSIGGAELVGAVRATHTEALKKAITQEPPK